MVPEEGREATINPRGGCVRGPGGSLPPAPGSSSSGARQGSDGQLDAGPLCQEEQTGRRSPGGSMKGRQTGDWAQQTHSRGRNGQ